MNEDSFQLILHAGNSKSSSMEAIMFARSGSFEAAAERVEDAKKELHKAHVIQTQLLVKESQGVKANPNMLMVHAQDHLNAAIVNLDISQELIFLYQEIQSIRKEMRGK